MLLFATRMPMVALGLLVVSPALARRRQPVSPPDPACEQAWEAARAEWAPIIAGARVRYEPNPHDWLVDALATMDQAAVDRDVLGYLEAILSSVPFQADLLTQSRFQESSPWEGRDWSGSLAPWAAIGRVLAACTQPDDELPEGSEHFLTLFEIQRAVPEPGPWLTEAFRALMVAPPARPGGAPATGWDPDFEALLESNANASLASEELAIIAHDLELCRSLGDWSEAELGTPERPPTPRVTRAHGRGGADWVLVFDGLAWDVTLDGNPIRLEASAVTILPPDGRMLTHRTSCSSPYELPPVAEGGARSEAMLDLLDEEVRQRLVDLHHAEIAFEAAFDRCVAQEEPWPRPLAALDGHLTPWSPAEGEVPATFTSLQWSPEARVRGSYAVELVGDDGFLAHGWIDADSDGEPAHYVIGKEGALRRETDEGVW